MKKTLIFLSLLYSLSFSQEDCNLDYNITDVNMTVQIYGEVIDAAMETIGINNYDVIIIAQFINNFGNLQVAGSVVYTPSIDNQVAIAVWGSESGMDNGFVDGEQINWAISNGSECWPLTAEMNSSNPFSPLYVSNGFGQVLDFELEEDQGCPPYQIASCYNDGECLPFYMLSDGECHGELSCYDDDGFDCAGGEGGWYIYDCELCESMNSDIDCYDALGAGVNCFGCSVYDECDECLGNGIGDNECDCDGSIIDECGECGGNGIPEGECDCFGNIIDECGICGGDGNWCFPPEANNANYTLTEDSMETISLSATDPDGDALTFYIVSQPLHGVVSLDGAAATYIPDVNFNGTDGFDFIVNDGLFDSNIATIDLTIVPVNDAPYWISLPQNEEIVVDNYAVYTLLAADVEGDDLAYSLADIIGPGTATLSSNVLTVHAHEEGTILVTVFVSDGMMTDEATIELLAIAQPCSEEYMQGYFDGASTGDVNFDGTLNVVDIVLSVQMILNGE
tara:strand:+ start:28 stop:1554 length:1527 start_codon:yes stop_codon:yes gene_type:complete